MRKIVLAAVTAASVFGFSGGASALTFSGTACSMADIQMVANPPTAQCAGYYDGNLASNATSADQTAGLLALGLTFPNAFTNAIQKLETSSNPTKLTSGFINFDQMLYGTTYIGIHWGNIPNPAGGQPLETNITAFYKFDAGAGLDKIFLSTANGSISNATLYLTGTSPVPEPTAWAMMVAGLGVVGAAMRRRAQVSFA